MPRLYLIRHARPRPRGPEDRDPPLDPIGVAEAEAMAAAFPPDPLPLYSSPLARCRMTAAPLAARWGRAPRMLEAVREAPAPGREGDGRGDFLNRLLLERWPEVLSREGSVMRRWYDGLISAVAGIDEDSAIVSHYVAINAIVGLATASDRVSCFKPGHASVTVVSVGGGRFALERLGAEARTQLTSG